MKYILGIWIVICFVPIIYFLLQDKSTKGISITDLNHTFMIFIIGLLLIFSIKMLIVYLKK